MPAKRQQALEWVREAMVGWEKHRPQQRRFSVLGKAARGGLGTLQRIGVPCASSQRDGEETRRQPVILWLNSEYNFAFSVIITL